MLVRVVSLAFLLLVTQIISTTCQDNTESIVETTVTTSSTIFNGPLADAKTVGKSITRPSGSTPDESKGINYEGTDGLKDLIQTTRTLDNFTTVSTPVTTILKSGNNDYVQEALNTEQITVNTDDTEQKEIITSLNLNYLTTERVLLVINNDAVEDDVHEDKSSSDENNDTRTTTTFFLPTDDTSIKHDENILYDNLDEYIYGDDISKDENVTTKTEVTKGNSKIGDTENESQSLQYTEQNFTIEYTEDLSTTTTTESLSYLLTEIVSLETVGVEKKNEEHVPTLSAITDESLQLLEVTPIEDYNSLSSTDSSNQISEDVTIDPHDHNIQATTTIDNIYLINESTEESRSRNSTEYAEDASTFPTTVFDHIIKTGDISMSTTFPFPFEVEESIITIPSTYMDQIHSERNFSADDYKNSFESVNVTTETNEILTQETSYQTVELTTLATTESADLLPNTYKEMNTEENVRNSDPKSLEKDSEASQNLTSHLSKDETHDQDILDKVVLLARNSSTSISGENYQNMKLREEVNANQLTTTNLPVMSTVINEEISTEELITKQYELYSDFDEDTTNIDLTFLTTSSSADDFFDNSKTLSSSNQSSLETTTTIIDIWLAERNTATPEYDYETSTLMTEDSTHSESGLNATQLTSSNGTDSTNSMISSTPVISAITSLIEDIKNSKTVNVSVNSLVETTSSLGLKSFNDYSSRRYDYEDSEKGTNMDSSDVPETEVTTLTQDEEHVYDNNYVESQRDVTTITNLPDLTTIKKDISFEFNAYEENVTSTIFSKELVDNGQFTADAINILQEDNYETTENQALTEDDYSVNVTSTEVNVNNVNVTEFDEHRYINKLQDDGSTSDIPEKSLMQTGEKMKHGEESVTTEEGGRQHVSENELTTSFFQQSSTDIINLEQEIGNVSIFQTEYNLQNYSVNKGSNTEEDKTDTENELNTDEKANVEKNVNVEEDMRFDTSTDSNEASDLYKESLSVDDVIDEKITRTFDTTKTTIKIEYEQKINGNNAVLTNEDSENKVIVRPSTTYDKEEINTDAVNDENTGTQDEIINSKVKMEENYQKNNDEEISNITLQSVTAFVEHSKADEGKTLANTTVAIDSQERITEENQFQQDSIITTDTVISSVQELEDLDLGTWEQTSISLKSNDFTTSANKLEVDSKDVITELKTEIPLTLAYDERQIFNEHTLKTYIDKITTENSRSEHIEITATSNNVVELLSGETSNGVEHTLTDRDTRRNNTMTIDQKNWQKISLNELVEEDDQEEIDIEDVDKITFEEELVHGNGNDSFIKAVSASYYDDYTSEEFNSSEAMDSSTQDDYTLYTLTIPERKEEYIYGNISFRIFIGEHILNIPEDFLVLLNASQHLYTIVISWKTEDVENSNSTVIVNIVDDQEDYFINFVEFEHADNIEATKSQKSGLTLLSTKIGDTMKGSTMIDFENGYQLELVDVNLQMKYNTLVEDPTVASQAKPVISKIMIVVVCISTATCLLLIVVAAILCRKLHTRATVYKMTIE
ncbi:hypothetical protein Trydic_g7539 [Trypoxylus dichotomus]